MLPVQRLLALQPCQPTLPSSSSRDAPPPVEMWLILSATPAASTAATESPPPMMVVAPGGGRGAGERSEVGWWVSAVEAAAVNLDRWYLCTEHVEV